MLKIFLCLVSIFISTYSYSFDYGIQWNCSVEENKSIKDSLINTLDKYDLLNFVEIYESDNKIKASISNHYAIESTLYLSLNPIYGISDEIVVKNINNKVLKKKVVSKKEILIALMYPGRLTEFSGVQGCKPNSIDKLLSIRQDIVFWTKDLSWVWPDGGSAAWNEEYWNLGTPKKLTTEELGSSFNDLFVNQDKYKIGCYTATKANYIQAYLSAYGNYEESSKNTLIDKLVSDKEPFVDIEPQDMWYFESDYIKSPKSSEGKLLTLQKNVSAYNFIPGDWVYIRNTDPSTNSKTGYEGSNTIYLGSGLFSDYYNDHQGGYPYDRKLDEVYQWRNGVFSRSRDAFKIKNLSISDRFRLSLTPEEGGLVENYRVVPKIF